MAQKFKHKVLVVTHKVCYMPKIILVDFQCGTGCYNFPNFIASRPREGLSTIITNTNQTNNQIKPNSKAHMVVYQVPVNKCLKNWIQYQNLESPRVGSP
ncbi:hypothetical protein RHMOL_Rhmol04G0177900 [Rhododendron molle]|uniref:Uncharacterized protein n=1 Tax=Rhododendron molle TaxID=49168 RepID=A0ACC0P2W4_RHOML|nr:hypothetical protein RHMOL_Rhmol04G0177900 [Rhododendron molle]